MKETQERSTATQTWLSTEIQMQYTESSASNINFFFFQTQLRKSNEVTKLSTREK